MSHSQSGGGRGFADRVAHAVRRGKGEEVVGLTLRLVAENWSGAKVDRWKGREMRESGRSPVSQERATAYRQMKNYKGGNKKGCPQLRHMKSAMVHPTLQPPLRTVEESSGALSLYGSP